MWTRKELKDRAKVAFKRNYWLCVLAAIIMIIVVGGGAAYTGKYTVKRVNNYKSSIQKQIEKDTKDVVQQTIKSKAVTVNGKTINFDNNYTAAKLEEVVNEMSAGINAGALNINGKEVNLSNPKDKEDATKMLTQFKDVLSKVKNYSDQDLNMMAAMVIANILGTLMLISLICFLLRLLVFNPLVIGCYSFFSENTKSNAGFGQIGRGFKPRYARNIGTMLLKDIFLALWTCLFIIPGIVKSYSSRMVSYILAEDPDISATDAITRSREMMNGHKWNAFVLDLSFIGWGILSALTFGILYIFYVGPYVYGTDAELYQTLKAQNN